jgi:hypothetical protein
VPDRVTLRARAKRAPGRAGEIIRAGPGAVLRIAYAVVAVTCWLALIPLLAIHGRGHHAPTRVAVAEAVVGVLLVLASGAFVADLWLRRRAPASAPGERRDLATAIIVAFTLWFPLVLVPVYLLARSSQPIHELAIEYGFFDKRWIVAFFLLGTIGTSFFLSVGGKLVRWAGGRSVPPAVASPGEPWTSQRYLILTAKLLVAVGLAAFFYGPHWTIAPIGGSIGYHEDVHLGGFQAIADGATPYVDQASVQYGPGSQLFYYLFMHHFGGVSIVGFRESFAMMHWLGATVFFAALFLRLRFILALISAVVAALFFPTLQLYGFASDRTYIGFFGWGNIVRFLGAFIIVLFFPVAVRHASRSGRRSLCVLLGFVWGVGCLFAQESLLAGLAGLLALTLLLVLSETVTFKRAIEGLAAVALGFLALWIPVLGFYASRGKLTDFVRTYLFFPRAVANGYSNTPFLEGWHSPWGPLYFSLPFIFAALGILGLVRLRPLRLATRWSDRRVTLVSLVIICAVSFQGSMLRADGSHLANGILALPALFVVGAAELPRLLGLEHRAVRWSASLALAFGVVVLIGPYERTPAAIQAAVMNPVHARLHPPHVDKLPPTASLAQRRIGDGLFRGPICCSDSTVSMNTLARFMDHLHGLLGRRPTYVASFPDGYPGIVYFLADLVPGPIYLERQMVIDESTEVPFLAYFKRHLRDTYAIVSMEAASPEMVAFRSAYPHARRITLPYPRAPLYVVMRGLPRSRAGA